MFSRKHFQRIMGFLIIILMISACSESPLITTDGIIQTASGSLSSEMAAFDGPVFVATTKPDHQRWLSAGWQISAQQVAGGRDSIPADCTLYPHQGVDDQWIGSCSGKTLIPRKGARHIAVMLTLPDGRTTMVQVAPPPQVNNP